MAVAVRGTVAVLYCALRESARMRSGEDGSLGTVNAEDGVFGCKTYGKPITRKIDIRKAYGELEDAARDLVRNLPQDTAGASAAASTALQPRYDNVKGAGTLYAAASRNDKFAHKLVNSSQAADFIKKKSGSTDSSSPNTGYLVRRWWKLGLY